jgi:hypothetical protein
MTEPKPHLIPMAIVPALLGRSKAVVWRMAARHGWPVISTPGYINRQRIAVVDLERLTGFTFSAAQIADAERRHDRALKEAAERLRQKRNACLSLGAVFDLQLAPNGLEDPKHVAFLYGPPTKH